MAADDSVKKKLKRGNKTPKIDDLEKRHDRVIDKKIKKKKKKTAGVVLEKVSSETFEQLAGSGEKDHDTAIDRKIKKKKKKTLGGVLEKVSPNIHVLSAAGDEAGEATRENKKSEESRNKKRKKAKVVADNQEGDGKTLKKEKRKRSVDVQTIDDYEEPTVSAERDDEDIGRTINPESIDQIAISGLEQADKRRSKTGKSKKAGKMKKKSSLIANNVAQDKVPEKQEAAPETEVHAMSLDKQEEAPDADVYEMSSGDEDYSNGMKKWIMQYHQSRPGIKVLQDRIDEFITDHEAQLEQKRKKQHEEAAEGGWTVVVHQRGRKKTTEAESGTAVGSVAAAVVLDNMMKKKKNKVGLDFYAFHRREEQKNKKMELLSKFELDKKRIQQSKAARKFRPY